MYVKKIKRICGVRGCKNTEVYAISKSRDMGNSVIACKDCLKEALESIANYKEPEKVKREIKPLFYHPELAVTVPSVAVNEPEPQEVIEEVTEDIQTSVAEDTVTIEEPKGNPIIHNVAETPKPKASNSKKSTKKR